MESEAQHLARSIEEELLQSREAKRQDLELLLEATDAAYRRMTDEKKSDEELRYRQKVLEGERLIHRFTEVVKRYMLQMEVQMVSAASKSQRTATDAAPAIDDDTVRERFEAVLHRIYSEVKEMGAPLNSDPQQVLLQFDELLEHRAMAASRLHQSFEDTSRAMHEKLLTQSNAQMEDFKSRLAELRSAQVSVLEEMEGMQRLSGCQCDVEGMYERILDQHMTIRDIANQVESEMKASPPPAADEAQSSQSGRSMRTEPGEWGQSEEFRGFLTSASELPGLPPSIRAVLDGSVEENQDADGPPHPLKIQAAYMRAIKGLVLAKQARIREIARQRYESVKSMREHMLQALRKQADGKIAHLREAYQVYGDSQKTQRDWTLEETKKSTTQEREALKDTLRRTKLMLHKRCHDERAHTDATFDKRLKRTFLECLYEEASVAPMLIPRLTSPPPPPSQASPIDVVEAEEQAADGAADRHSKTPKTRLTTLWELLEVPAGERRTFAWEAFKSSDRMGGESEDSEPLYRLVRGELTRLLQALQERIAAAQSQIQ
ncbi:unnamed protein product [Vitrella brassicaformis CCMP3155]|uniref:Uncharacterized protein n=2 Tax=Vitrella brassicaformis TaxID=1169539 RepID=A0A0G4EMX9_VITBC|nr:unnamed protein product [Vitrella brassicaformis CCMP3155]|eukprot:CEL99182.1 unnamed protein product [Vitrella brassicaformis CCMP3155]